MNQDYLVPIVVSGLIFFLSFAPYVIIPTVQECNDGENPTLCNSNLEYVKTYYPITQMIATLGLFMISFKMVNGLWIGQDLPQQSLESGSGKQ